MMRREKPVAGTYYHLYNRGVRQEPIFLENSDRIRFLFLLLYCQLPLPLSNNEYHANLFEKHGSFYLHANRDQILAALSSRRVELVNFCLMPNHFHLSVLARTNFPIERGGRAARKIASAGKDSDMRDASEENLHGRAKEESGIPKYMQRALNAYTKYFNIKHKKTGHLFQGPYQLVRVKNNDQLLHLSAYIHRNPRELREWRGREFDYPHSSLQDFVGENRWGELLKPDIVLGQFKSGSDYKRFVETSSAKTLENKLEKEHQFEE